MARKKKKKKKKPLTRAQKILAEAREKRKVVQLEQKQATQEKLQDAGIETLYVAEEDPELEFKIRESWGYKFDEEGYRVYYNSVSKAEVYSKPTDYDDRDVQYPTPGEHLIDDIFKALDVNNQGFLTEKELQTFMENEEIVEIPRKLSFLMQVYDTNHDGKIQLEEWRYMLKQQHDFSPGQFDTFTTQYGMPDKYYYYGKGGKEGDPRHPEQMNEIWDLEENLNSDADTNDTKQDIEKRYDPNDGQLYTQIEFQQCYGGLEEWGKALPEATPAEAEEVEGTSSSTTKSKKTTTTKKRKKKGKKGKNKSKK